MQTRLFPVEKLAEQVVDLLSSGGTLGDVYDFSDKDYEVVYALGSQQYQQGHYFDAMNAFGYLVIHNTWERRFVNAFAASLQMLKRYDDAIAYYSFVSVMDMRDPVPTYHSAECMIALGRMDDAKQALEFVVQQSSGEKWAALKVRAQTMLAGLARGETR